MLRPPSISSANYGVALRPSQGYAEELHFSLEPTVELGSLEVVAANSGTYTARSGDNLALADNPQELGVMLATNVNMGAEGSTIVISIVGTYDDDSPMTGVATFDVPAYATDQTARLGQTIAFEVVRSNLTKKVKTITSVVPSTAGATAVGARFKVFGLPSITEFTKVGCRDSMDWAPKVQAPHAVRCANNPQAFVLPGDIMEGTLNVTTKIPSEVDGLTRVNGQRVTGLIKIRKEGLLDVMYVYLIGLIITGRRTAPEGAEPSTFQGTGMYEETPQFWAL